jgi:hypothetical protein
MRKAILAGVLAALAIPAAPALAFTGSAPVAPAIHQTALASGVVSTLDAAQGYHDRDRDRYERRRDRYDNDRYDRQGRYRNPHRMSRNDRIWRGRDGRYYCKRDNGTTGLVIGAAVGGLAGHEIAGRGDRTLGVILGAAGGGLLGRAIDRGDMKCR